MKKLPVLLALFFAVNIGYSQVLIQSTIDTKPIV